MYTQLGPTGATGPTGVVAATAPVTYNSGTSTVGLNIGSSLTTSASNLIVDSTVVPYLGTANTFTGGVQQITTASAATKGLIIKATTGQSVNLQEWQNSSTTTPVTYISAAGNLFSPGSYIGVGGISDSPAGTGPYITMGAANTTVQARSATNIVLIAKGAASQSANLTEWQDSTGSILARIASDGTILSNSNVSATFFSASSATGGLAVQGTYALRFNGASNANFGTASPTGGVAQVQITNATTTAVGLIVKGAASQTANLQEWQNSAGTVLAKVTSDGSF
jgi:hypothetical protein